MTSQSQYNVLSIFSPLYQKGCGCAESCQILLILQCRVLSIYLIFQCRILLIERNQGVVHMYLILQCRVLLIATSLLLLDNMWVLNPTLNQSKRKSYVDSPSLTTYIQQNTLKPLSLFCTVTSNSFYVSYLISLIIFFEDEIL